MSIEINAEGLDRAIDSMQEILDTLGGKNAAKAVAKALNHSLSKGRRQASLEARKAYTAPIKKLFDNIKIRRARVASLEGQLEIIGSKGVSLIHFTPVFPDFPVSNPALVHYQGVHAQTKKKGAYKERFGNAGGSKSFIMKKKQGGYGVFVRHKRKTNPFEMLFGPSPVQALQRRDTHERVAEKIEEAFKPALEDEIDKMLGALGGSK